jgi:hypothetical protein
VQGIYGSYAAGMPSGPQNRLWRWNTLGVYAQDDVRATSGLTLNLGVRYEFQTVPREANGIESRFLNFADPTQTWTYGPIMRNPSLKNFSPRVGFAWDVNGNGRMSIRSGFGLYYDVATMGTALNQIPSASPPFSSGSTISSNAQRLVLPVPVTFPAASGSLCASDLPPDQCTNRLQGMNYNVGQPRSLQYNFTFEHALPLGMGLGVSYVGSRGMHLWQVREGNPIPPTNSINGSPAWMPFLCDGTASAVPCAATVATTSNPVYRRINPAYASNIEINTFGESWYNSLQVLLRKRLSHGLDFQANYALGKSTDTTQGPLFTGECADVGLFEGISPLNPQNDKGPSCFDVLHNFHVNVLYHLPNIKSDGLLAKFFNGWWMGNIVSAHSGLAFTPLLNVGRSNNGNYAGFGTQGIVDRPDVGADTTSATFRCSGTGSAFPGAPPCANGSVTYTYIPYNKDTVITHDPNGWFNPLMFRLAPAGTQGNAPRGVLRGPGLFNWDLSLNKDMGRLQFRAEIFNILNHTNFALPASVGRTFVGTLTDAAGASEAPIANVGRITQTATPSRQIQLALKFIF